MNRKLMFALSLILVAVFWNCTGTGGDGEGDDDENPCASLSEGVACEVDDQSGQCALDSSGGLFCDVILEPPLVECQISIDCERNQICTDGTCEDVAKTTLRTSMVQSLISSPYTQAKENAAYKYENLYEDERLSKVILINPERKETPSEDDWLELKKQDLYSFEYDQNGRAIKISKFDVENNSGYLTMNDYINVNPFTGIIHTKVYGNINSLSDLPATDHLLKASMKISTGNLINRLWFFSNSFGGVASLLFPKSSYIEFLGIDNDVGAYINLNYATGTTEIQYNSGNRISSLKEQSISGIESNTFYAYNDSGFIDKIERINKNNEGGITSNYKTTYMRDDKNRMTKTEMRRMTCNDENCSNFETSETEILSLSYQDECIEPSIITYVREANYSPANFELRVNRNSDCLPIESEFFKNDKLIVSSFFEYNNGKPTLVKITKNEDDGSKTEEKFTYEYNSSGKTKKIVLNQANFELTLSGEYAGENLVLFKSKYSNDVVNEAKFKYEGANLIRVESSSDDSSNGNSWDYNLDGYAVTADFFSKSSSGGGMQQQNFYKQEWVRPSETGSPIQTTVEEFICAPSAPCGFCENSDEYCLMGGCTDGGDPVEEEKSSKLDPLLLKINPPTDALSLKKDLLDAASPKINPPALSPGSINLIMPPELKVKCAPNCEERECGDDGCGGSCGTCDTGWGCNESTGKCETKG